MAHFRALAMVLWSFALHTTSAWTVQSGTMSNGVMRTSSTVPRAQALVLQYSDQYGGDQYAQQPQGAPQGAPQTSELDPMMVALKMLERIELRLQMVEAKVDQIGSTQVLDGTAVGQVDQKVDAICNSLYGGNNQPR